MAAAANLGRVPARCRSALLGSVLIGSLLRALRVTVATALTGWGCSLLIGVVLGCLSSERLWLTFRWPGLPALLLRRLLALPRSVRELIWGLLLLQVFGLHLGGRCRDHHPLCRPGRVCAISCRASTLPGWRLLQAGASPLSACFTAFAPAMGGVLMSYGGYRLECALRSATLLGVFGPVASEPILISLKSLRFKAGRASGCWHW